MSAGNGPAQVYANAVAALNRRQWSQAQSLARNLLPGFSGHAGVHFVLGVAALEQGSMPTAARHLYQAVKLNPGRADYSAQWVRLLAASHRLREAAIEADRVFQMQSRDPLVLNILAVVYTQANAHQKAASVFQSAVAVSPGQAVLHFNLATSLIAIGDLEGAAREYETCLELDPRYWKAHLAVAQLRRQTRQDNHIERLQSLLHSAAGEAEAELYLNLALDKEYDDLGEHHKAFDHLQAGKAAWRGKLDYSIGRDQAVFDALMRACDGRPGKVAGNQTREPIFIIGMPRTGTTLVERILSSHPQVHSAGELQNFPVALKRASASLTRPLLDPETIARTGGIDWEKLGQDYLDSTRPGTGRTPHFIDKLPHNFLYAGFIAKALPQAKLICLRRDPMDTCVSNFRQLFALSSPYYDYSFDLLDTGRYYLLFDRLMAHWRTVLPGRILEIDYESIVEDQHAGTRRLLEHCGLPWDEACLQFEKNAAPVSTASAVQVRSAIYRTSLQRWKRYESQLGELRTLLETGAAGAG